jgi:hypothetical protein
LREYSKANAGREVVKSPAHCRHRCRSPSPHQQCALVERRIIVDGRNEKAIGPPLPDPPGDDTVAIVQPWLEKARSELHDTVAARLRCRQRIAGGAALVDVLAGPEPPPFRNATPHRDRDELRRNSSYSKSVWSIES